MQSVSFPSGPVLHHAQRATPSMVLAAPRTQVAGVATASRPTGCQQTCCVSQAGLLSFLVMYMASRTGDSRRNRYKVVALRGTHRSQSLLLRRAAEKDEDSAKDEPSSTSPEETSGSENAWDPFAGLNKWWSDFWQSDYWNEPIAVDSNILAAGSLVVLIGLFTFTVNLMTTPQRDLSQDRLDKLPMIGLRKTFVRDPSRFEQKRRDPSSIFLTCQDDGVC
eukprot:TRINITY_DN104810_c0_g1_i1.p1 TRINITY_DN104810_c0_g1~~TRINITY_DN104810_c0_g1_i1.p1  ORF type:complete len:221 (+),score=24.73 TRINITY_DN104810_c0_g1_i1:72-734(+)